MINRNNNNQRIQDDDNQRTQNNNNQKIQDKINLDQLFDTKNVLDKVKKNLYNAMCYYWRFLPEDYLLSTIFDLKVKYIYNKEEKEEILHKKYDKYKEDYLPTPIESRASSPTQSEIFSTMIYQPRLFAAFN